MNRVRRPSLLLACLLASTPLVAGAGGDTPGEATQLLVTGYDRDTGRISITFETACASTDHHIEFGPLDAVGTPVYTGQDCDLGVSGSYDAFDPGTGSVFFVVVGNDGVAIEGSYGTDSDGTLTEREPDLSDPLCAFEQDLSRRCDGPVVPVVELTAFRPQSEAYGMPIRRAAVPEADELSPGVGVRVNGDDDNSNAQPDSAEASVAGENDLVEITLFASPGIPPEGVQYLLNGVTAIFYGMECAPTKETELFGAGDSLVLTFESGASTVWVELPQPVQSELDLVARSLDDQSVVATDGVRLFPFTSVIIALGGESQVPADPPLEPDNHGTFQVALDLYHRGYDVHMYDEDVVSASGAGAGYDEVVRAVRDRAVTSVAIFGYSHGGGSTNDLARRLDDNRASIGTFSIDFTAYVDGIDNDSDIDIGTETALPPSTGYHANYYENPGCGFFALCGGPIAGADFDLDVTTTPWGASLTHFTVDDAPEVTGGVRDQLLPRVPR